MTKNDLISRNPKILGGTPVIKGTRIPVSLLKKLLNSGWPVKVISQEYPSLTPKTIRAFKASI